MTLRWTCDKCGLQLSTQGGVDLSGWATIKVYEKRDCYSVNNQKQLAELCPKCASELRANFLTEEGFQGGPK